MACIDNGSTTKVLPTRESRPKMLPFSVYLVENDSHSPPVSLIYLADRSFKFKHHTREYDHL